MNPAAKHRLHLGGPQPALEFRVVGPRGRGDDGDVSAAAAIQVISHGVPATTGHWLLMTDHFRLFAVHTPDLQPEFLAFLLDVFGPQPVAPGLAQIPFPPLPALVLVAVIIFALIVLLATVTTRWRVAGKLRQTFWLFFA